jgi:hypothetical protein
LKHNLKCKKKNWLEKLALVVKTAISKLDIIEQQNYRYVVAKTVKTVKQEDNKNNVRGKSKWKLITNILYNLITRI